MSHLSARIRQLLAEEMAEISSLIRAGLTDEAERAIQQFAADLSLDGRRAEAGSEDVDPQDEFNRARAMQERKFQRGES